MLAKRVEWTILRSRDSTPLDFLLKPLTVYHVIYDLD